MELETVMSAAFVSIVITVSRYDGLAVIGEFGVSAGTAPVDWTTYTMPANTSLFGSWILGL